MGSHPINLAFRFLLEIMALTFIGIWGWQLGEGWTRLLIALAIPAFTASIWGIFNVPNDPSRSGKAPVSVPGVLRLLIELAYFAFATWVVYDLGFPDLSLVLGIAVILHYLFSYDRVFWLLQNPKNR